MSTWLQRAEESLEKHATALKIIEGIASLVKDALVKPNTDANAVLQAIERAIDTLIKGFDGKVTQTEVDKVIQGMRDRIAVRDAAKDAALDAKFEDGGSD